MKDAKPCPFCGSEPIAVGTNDGYLTLLAIFDDGFVGDPLEVCNDIFDTVFLACEECDMRGPEAKATTAIEMWNRRHTEKDQT